MRLFPLAYPVCITYQYVLCYTSLILTDIEDIGSLWDISKKPLCIFLVLGWRGMFRWMDGWNDKQTDGSIDLCHSVRCLIRFVNQFV